MSALATTADTVAVWLAMSIDGTLFLFDQRYVGAIESTLGLARDEDGLVPTIAVFAVRAAPRAAPRDTADDIDDDLDAAAMTEIGVLALGRDFAPHEVTPATRQFFVTLKLSMDAPNPVVGIMCDEVNVLRAAQVALHPLPVPVCGVGSPVRQVAAMHVDPTAPSALGFTLDIPMMAAHLGLSKESE